MTYQIGQRVEFTAYLDRAFEWNGAGLSEHGGWSARKAWRRNPLTAPVRGVIVGARSLRNGVANYGEGDSPTTFKVTEPVPAYLVATGLRQAHWRVLPEDITWIDDAGTPGIQ